MIIAITRQAVVRQSGNWPEHSLQDRFFHFRGEI